MTTLASDTNPAQKRHWMYGLNVAMLVAIGIIILAFLLVMGEQTRRWGHWDWTTGGHYSLSSSTKSELKEVADQKQTYQMMSLYPNPGQSAGEASGAGSQQEKYRQVNDLLEEYGRASSAVKVEDAGDLPREEIERRVRDLYAGELKPYQDAVEDFDPLARNLSDFMKKEAAAIGAAGQKPGTPAEEVRAAAMLQAEFSSAPSGLEQIQRAIRRETDQQVLPRWSSLTDLIKENVEEIEPTFALLADPVKLKEADVPASLVAYFTSAQDGYKKMADSLKAYKERLSKLEPLKVQDVLTKLDRNSVVILGPTSAKVLSEWELYESNASPTNPDAGGGQTFNGEQALSSAMLSMIRPDKIKVVFITAAPQRLMSDMFAATTTMLQQSNFEVLEWSPPGMPSPNSPPPEPNPPAQGKDAQGRPVIWIVFPPEAANPQAMMMGMPPPSPQPVIDATRKHLAEGGQVLFLAEADAASPMMPMMGTPGYPYQELLNDFGVEVQSKYTIVRAQEGEDESGKLVRQVLPLVPVDRFEDHEITRPLQALRTIFAFGRGQMGPMGMPTVVSLKKPLPAGVEAQVISNTPPGGDYWAESNFAPDAKFDRGTDLPSPAPIAVAAIKNKGDKDKEQRVVVIGSKLFAADYFLTLAQPRVVGNRLIRDPMFPGNRELMRNTILWLAGYENLISVSSKAIQAARIRDIPPAQLAMVRWGVLGGAPIAALLLGGAIYMMRRKN
jgi:hypothetical protein